MTRAVCWQRKRKQPSKRAARQMRGRELRIRFVHDKRALRRTFVRSMSAHSAPGSVADCMGRTRARFVQTEIVTSAVVTACCERWSKQDRANSFFIELRCANSRAQFCAAMPHMAAIALLMSRSFEDARRTAGSIRIAYSA